MSLPCSSRTGDTVTDTGIALPSLRRRSVSYRTTRAPPVMAPAAAVNSATRPGGHKAVPGWPMISSAEYPYMAAAAGFQFVITPSGLKPMIASPDDRTIAASSPSGGVSVRFLISSSCDWPMSPLASSVPNWESADE